MVKSTGCHVPGQDTITHSECQLSYPSWCRHQNRDDLILFFLLYSVPCAPYSDGHTEHNMPERRPQTPRRRQPTLYSTYYTIPVLLAARALSAWKKGKI